MKKPSDLPITLQKLAASAKHVFYTEDLTHLFNTHKGPTLNKRIADLIQRGYLHRAIRGVYFTENASLENLALKMFPEGYLSLGTALSIHQMIGTKPTWKTSILTSKSKGKTFKTVLGTVEMSIQKPTYTFGIDSINGQRIANKEKAFIDTCYFHLRGHQHPFNLYTDIDVSRLHPKIVAQYLRRYQNKKFIAFTENLLVHYGF